MITTTRTSTGTATRASWTGRGACLAWSSSSAPLALAWSTFSGPAAWCRLVSVDLLLGAGLDIDLVGEGVDGLGQPFAGGLDVGLDLVGGGVLGGRGVVRSSLNALLDLGHIFLHAGHGPLGHRRPGLADLLLTDQRRDAGDQQHHHARRSARPARPAARWPAPAPPRRSARRRRRRPAHRPRRTPRCLMPAVLALALSSTWASCISSRTSRLRSGRHRLDQVADRGVGRQAASTGG